MPSLPMDLSAIEVLAATAEPTSGYSVLAELDPQSRSFVIPQDARPQEGKEMLLAVRRLDSQGRRSAMSRWRRVRRVSEGLRYVPPPALFPTFRGWHPRIVGDQGWAMLVLAGGASSLGWSQFALEREDAAGEIVALAIIDAADVACEVTWSFTLLATQQRLRWRMLAQDQLGIDGPWSAWFRMAPANRPMTGISIRGGMS